MGNDGCERINKWFLWRPAPEIATQSRCGAAPNRKMPARAFFWFGAEGVGIEPTDGFKAVAG